MKLYAVSRRSYSAATFHFLLSDNPQGKDYTLRLTADVRGGIHVHSWTSGPAHKRRYRPRKGAQFQAALALASRQFRKMRRHTAPRYALVLEGRHSPLAMDLTWAQAESELKNLARNATILEQAQ